MTTTNYAELTKIANLLKDLNLVDNVLETPRTIEEGATRIDIIPLDPAECGPMMAMLQEIAVEIYWNTFMVGKDKDLRLTVLTIDYSYVHPGGGRNGYRVQYVIEGEGEIKLR
ncbi:MAG: hypothetical protein GY827_04610 [Cytophagales bacterium]|nr:hypothetical protein [Cytophagales bacterium]